MSGAVPSAANVYQARQSRSLGHDDGHGSITRCPCFNNSDADGFMIACETCGVWQHGSCVGVDDKTVPDQYYCEYCMPDHPIHIENAPRRRMMAAAFQARDSVKKIPKVKNGTGADAEKSAKRKRSKKDEDEDSGAAAAGPAAEDSAQPPESKKPKMDENEGNSEDDKHASREERKLKKLLESIKKMEDRMVKKSGKSNNPGAASPSQTRDFDPADQQDINDDHEGLATPLPRPVSQADFHFPDGENFQVKISSLDPNQPSIPIPYLNQQSSNAEDDGDISPQNQNSAAPSPTAVSSSIQSANPISSLSASSGLPTPSPGPGRPPRVRKQLNNQPNPPTAESSDSAPVEKDKESDNRPFPGSSFHHRRQIWRSNRLQKPLAPMYFGLKQYILDEWKEFQYEKDNSGWTKRAQLSELPMNKRLLINLNEKKRLEEIAAGEKLARNQSVKPEIEEKTIRFVEKPKIEIAEEANKTSETNESMDQSPPSESLTSSAVESKTAPEEISVDSNADSSNSSAEPMETSGLQEDSKEQPQSAPIDSSNAESSKTIEHSDASESFIPHSNETKSIDSAIASSDSNSNPVSSHSPISVPLAGS